MNTYWPEAENSLSKGGKSNFSGTQMVTANPNLRDEDARVLQGLLWKEEV